MKTFLIRFVVPVTALLVAAAIVLRLTAGVSDLQSLPRLERPWLLAAAVVTMTLTGVAYGLLWHCLASGLDAGRPPILQSMAVFSCSWLGRYLPSGAPYVAGAIVLGSRLGHRRLSLAAALVYLNVVVACVFCSSAALAMPFTLDGGPSALLWIALASLSISVLMLLPSPLVRRPLQFVSSRWPRLSALERSRIPGESLLTASMIALVAAALNGISFAFVLYAFTELDVRTIIAAAAAFNIAGAAGIAAVPVPSGLGVREAVLIALLHSVVPIELATAAIVLARLLSILVDIGLGVAGAALLARASYLRSGDRRGAPIMTSAAPGGR